MGKHQFLVALALAQNDVIFAQSQTPDPPKISWCRQTVADGFSKRSCQRTLVWKVTLPGPVHNSSGGSGCDSCDAAACASVCAGFLWSEQDLGWGRPEDLQEWNCSCLCSLKEVREGKEWYRGMRMAQKVFGSVYHPLWLGCIGSEPRGHVHLSFQPGPQLAVSECPPWEPWRAQASRLQSMPWAFPTRPQFWTNISWGYCSWEFKFMCAVVCCSYATLILQLGLQQ